LLRLAATRQRLAVAACNGDWPADNEQRWEVQTCAACEMRWAPSVIRRDGRCADCHAEEQMGRMVHEACAGWEFEAQGDPRGECSRIWYGELGERRAMAIPTRR
jgi:hypothetical protein